jgi:hypothetical protein
VPVVNRLTHRRGTLALIAFGAQLTFVLVLIVLSPHFSGACPQSIAVQAQAARCDQIVTSVDIGLFLAVAVTLVF